MCLNSLNGHLFSVKDTCSQGSFHIGLFKELGEVFDLSGTGGGNDRDGNVFANIFHKFNVKATIGNVFIDASEELGKASLEILMIPEVFQR